MAISIVIDFNYCAYDSAYDSCQLLKMNYTTTSTIMDPGLVRGCLLKRQKVEAKRVHNKGESALKTSALRDIKEDIKSHFDWWGHSFCRMFIEIKFVNFQSGSCFSYCCCLWVLSSWFGLSNYHKFSGRGVPRFFSIRNATFLSMPPPPPYF